VLAPPVPSPDLDPAAYIRIDKPLSRLIITTYCAFGVCDGGCDMDCPLELSVVVPLLNEAESLDELYASLKQLLDDIGKSYELILVDDGSSDGTAQRIKDIAHLDPCVKAIIFRRNFGQTAALSAAFDHAQGDVVVTIDGDLQQDPADIPLLLDKLEEGYDIVCGWRHQRKDNFFLRTVPSRIANALISRSTGVYLHDYGCSLKAFRKEIVKKISLYGDMHRFIPAIARRVGASMAEVKVSHFPRRHGKSKYGLRRVPRVLLDLILVKFLLAYFHRPIQVFGKLGLLCILGAFACGVEVIITKFGYGTDVTGNPFTYLAVVLVLLGAQFISLGIIGEINIRIYHETTHTPIYVIREIVGEEADSKNKHTT